MHYYDSYYYYCYYYYYCEAGQRYLAQGKGMDDQKGKGKDGASELLPRGIRPRTPPPANKMVCYAHNQGRPCKQQNCPMEHVCWFSHASDHNASNCRNKPN